MANLFTVVGIVAAVMLILACWFEGLDRRGGSDGEERGRGEGGRASGGDARKAEEPHESANARP